MKKKRSKDNSGENLEQKENQRLDCNKIARDEVVKKKDRNSVHPSLKKGQKKQKLHDETQTSFVK